MRIDIITIFPELFDAFLETSLVGRAMRNRLLDVSVHDLRDYSSDPHRSVDDEPYGGGGGMVMAAPPWIAAVRALSGRGESTWRILLSPQGGRLQDSKVQALAERPHLILMCGRYEGIDERVRQLVVDEEISIGDYVLAGGEIPAMVIIESLSRQVPGVVGLAESVEAESFRHGLLDHPHYTRPRVVEGLEVPGVLVSGDHKAIERWRREQAFRATQQKRPDILGGARRRVEVGREAREKES